MAVTPLNFIPPLANLALIIGVLIHNMIRLRARESLTPEQKTLLDGSLLSVIVISILGAALYLGIVAQIHYRPWGYQPWLMPVTAAVILSLSVRAASAQLRRLEKHGLPAAFLLSLRKARTFLICALFLFLAAYVYLDWFTRSQATEKPVAASHR